MGVHLSLITDENCDNLAEEWTIWSSGLTHRFDRRMLETGDHAKIVDRILQEAQPFICPENEGEEILFKEFLRSYQQ